MPGISLRASDAKAFFYHCPSLYARAGGTLAALWRRHYARGEVVSHAIPRTAHGTRHAGTRCLLLTPLSSFITAMRRASSAASYLLVEGRRRIRRGGGTACALPHAPSRFAAWFNSLPLLPREDLVPRRDACLLPRVPWNRRKIISFSMGLIALARLPAAGGCPTLHFTGAAARTVTSRRRALYRHRGALL